VSVAKRRNAIFRGKPRYRPQRTVLVICEDLKSGKNYLQDANQHFRSHLQIEVIHCGYTDPRGIVAEALTRARNFDQVFCVIDRDAHANFDEALRLAKQSDKVDVCVSYPCFEFWLLLHFKYTRKPYAAAGKRSAADRLVADLCAYPGMQKYDKGRSKGLFAELLGDRFDMARKHAPRALRDALEKKEMNPSTRLFEVLELMERMATPQILD
jgi:hypothetical protein